MTRNRFALAALLALLAALLGLAAAGAQTGGQTGGQGGSAEVRIAARKAADGSVELCLYLNAEKTRRCPTERYFRYPDVLVNEWRSSSAIEAGRATLTIRARRDTGGWVELTLAARLDGVTQVHRPERRFFNWPGVAVDRWLRSSPVSVETGGGDVATGLAVDAPRLQRGRAAPQFTLQRLEGEGAVSLADYSGKTVVLAFWSSWDAGGVQLLHRLDQLWRAGGGANGGLAVLAINVYDATGAAQRAFVEANVGFDGVIDSGAEVTRHYRVDGLPELVVIDADGVYRERVTGAADTRAIERAIAAANRAAGGRGGLP